MRKIEGLKFLQTFFFDNCVDCIFVTKNEPLDVMLLKNRPTNIFRIRSGRCIGSEIGTPQSTCYSPREVEEFINKAFISDNRLEFVIHRVREAFFKPRFVGTIALFDKPNPAMVIDFQAVSEELIAKMDSAGLRPRDWETVATLCYPYQRYEPNIYTLNPSFKLHSIKEDLYHLWQIGRMIDTLMLMQNNGEVFNESVTRFNIYPSGKILLDDHRTLSSFSGR